MENRQEIPNFMAPELMTSLGLTEQRMWVSQSLLLCDRKIWTFSAPSRQLWLLDCYPGMSYLDLLSAPVVCIWPIHKDLIKEEIKTCLVIWYHNKHLSELLIHAILNELKAPKSFLNQN